MAQETTEVEVTKEMVRAGVYALSGFDLEAETAIEDFHEVVKTVFLAMMEVRKQTQLSL
jgi:hypothetical protein